MSEWITAEEYRTAAKVARSSGGEYLPAAANAWVGRANMLDARTTHFRQIGYLCGDPDAGTRVAKWLRDNGWTPPEWLTIPRSEAELLVKEARA